jgi:hypothetical protein
VLLPGGPYRSRSQLRGWHFLLVLRALVKLPVAHGYLIRTKERCLIRRKGT